MSRPAVEQLYPLSPAQRGLMAQELVAPQQSHYIVQVVATLRGALDRQAFEAAWRLVQTRHEALRSSFVWESVAEPLQVVHRQTPLPLHWAEATTATWLDGFLAEQRRRGIPLKRPPLFSITLGRVDEETHHLVWCYHHLLLDGWSSAIVLREVFTAYAQLAGGGEAALPAAVSYRRYVSWLQQQDTPEAERFWTSHLAGVPAGRAREPIEQPDPVTRGRLVSAELEQSIDAFRRRERLTTATLVHGIWALLMARRSGVDDLVVGSVVSGRPETLEGAGSIVGSLINVLPIRVRLDGRRTIGDWLRGLQATLQQARQHGAVPVGRLAQWAGHAGRPLFDTLLTIENYPDALWHRNPAGTRLRVENMRVVESTDYVLTLEAVPARRLLLQVLFDRRRLPTDGIEDLLSEAESLLQLLTVDGRRQLEVALRPERRVARPIELRDETLVSRFAAVVQRHSGSVAVECDEVSVTYDRLARRAAGIAGALRRLGVAAEDRIVLLLDRSPELIAAMLGVVQAGACYVPIEPGTPADRVRLLVDDCGATVAITTTAWSALMPGLACVLVDGPVPLEDAPPKAFEVDRASPHPDQAAYVIYTSGSTGQPKGVIVTHRNVMRLFDATAAWTAFDAGDVWSLFHSCAFDFSVWEIFGALLHGGRLVIVPPATSRSPEDFARLLAERGVTVLNQTPSAFRLLAPLLADPEAAHLPALRLVIFGGEALSYDVLGPFIGRYGDRPQLVNMYGITETTVHVTARPVRLLDPAMVQASPIGGPIDDLRVCLLDPTGLPVDDGHAGEICVAGPGLARGYLGAAGLTAQRFVPDPDSPAPGGRLYRSGDLGRRGPNGDLEYLGRLDRQIKVRGVRVEPGEIEAALRSHAAVNDAVVVLQVERDEAQLVAHVVPASASAAPVRRLAAAMAAHPERQICELPNGIALFHEHAAATQMMFEEIVADSAYLRHGVSIGDGACVFDVGANIGLFSVSAQSAARDVEVFAFEPMPVFDLLAANFDCHGISGRAINVALGAEDGEATLTYYPHVSVVSGRAADPALQRDIVGAYVRQQHGGALEEADLQALLDDRLTSQQVSCRMRRLSDVRRELGVEWIDLLKIDVEGGEEAVLDGIDDQDWPRIRQLVLEVHGEEARDRVATRLRGRGFTTAAAQQDMLRDSGMWIVYATSPSRRRLDVTGRSADPVVWRSPARLMQALRAYLDTRLTPHLLPHVLTPIASLPLTANGKIDVAALRPARPSAAAAGDAQRPRTHVETTLGAIWEDLLGIGGVALDANFFELGGDSIVAVQLVSRARRAGLRLTPAQVFEQRTLAALAAVVAPLAASSTVAGHPRVRTGTLPLSPIQHWFFEQSVPNRSHWNQAVLFEIAGLSREALEDGLRAALRAHDVFALGFTQSADGWRQDYGAPRIPEPLLPSFASAQQHEVIATLQQSLDLADGPLVRAALFQRDDGAPPQLLLIAHHLIVDAVSWRILVEDIVAAARSAAAGRPAVVAPPPTSFRDWTEWLAGEAANPDLAIETAPYLESLRRPTPPLPCDLVAGNDLERSAAVVSRVLAPSEATALEDRVARPAGMSTGHVVLAAVAAAVSQWTGAENVRVDLESHARDLPGAPETALTVGWFTSIAPVVLPAGAAAEIPDLLRVVKDAVALMPRAGQAYGMLRYLATGAVRDAWRDIPRAELIFNFLGRVGTNAGDRDVRLIDPTVGTLHDPEAVRTHRIVIEAASDESGLRLAWLYGSATHTARTIERLAESTMAVLRRMLALAAYDRVLAPAPTDFPLANLNADELTTVLRSSGNIVDAYPLSAAQQGMFFHALFAPASPIYFTQFHWRMDGPLDVDAFWRSWDAVVRRQPMLRTSFMHRGLREPVQLVYEEASVPVEYHDWRDSGGDWDRFVAGQRTIPFDLERPPLMRLALVQTGERHYRFVWNHHHILFDGWCTGLILADVFSAYEALAAGRPLSQPLTTPAPSYRSYVEWLSRRDQQAAAEFWRTRLTGWDPVALCFDATDGAEDDRPIAWELPLQVDGELRALAQRGITLNTAVVGAWALVLSVVTGRHRVIVGSTTAGRPAELEDAEHIVGLFVTTLPMPVEVLMDAEVGVWLERVQALQVEARAFDHVGLSQIQRWCGRAGGTALIDTAVVFENLPAFSVRRRSLPDLRVSDVGSFVRNNFALTIRVVPTTPLRLEVLFDGARVGRSVTSALLDALAAMLCAIAAAPGRRVGSLVDLVGASPRLTVGRS